MHGWLILIRLGLGLMFLSVSAALGYCYTLAKAEHVIAAAGIACVINFVAGVIFVSGAIDMELWREPPANRRDNLDELPDYSIKAD